MSNWLVLQLLRDHLRLLLIKILLLLLALRRNIVGSSWLLNSIRHVHNVCWLVWLILWIVLLVCRRLLLYVLLAGRRMHRGGHVDVLSRNLRWLSIWLGSVVSLCCSASCVCSLSSLVALNAEAEHDYHSNESQDTYCHPDVLTNLTRVGLHRSVHIHTKLHCIVCVVERSDVLA